MSFPLTSVMPQTNIQTLGAISANPLASISATATQGQTNPFNTALQQPAGQSSQLGGDSQQPDTQQLLSMVATLLMQMLGQNSASTQQSPLMDSSQPISGSGGANRAEGSGGGGGCSGAQGSDDGDDGVQSSDGDNDSSDVKAQGNDDSSDVKSEGDDSTKTKGHGHKHKTHGSSDKTTGQGDASGSKGTSHTSHGASADKTTKKKAAA